MNQYAEKELSGLVFQTFEQLAINGYIGDPSGEDAYGYLRVSTDQQADENRAGLPRQIERIHEISKEKRKRISWDRIVADDFSGFDFEHRPQLQKLLKETINPNTRRANVIVMEQLDRLSRQADWHQGYLLEKFIKDRGMEVIFWKSFGSRIERVVMGAISQDGMEDAQGRMKDGKKRKAKNKKVTASVRAYGYERVDPDGKFSERTQRETHYKIKDDESIWIIFIFNEIAIKGTSARQVAKMLNEKSVLCRNSKAWEASDITRIIHNPLYKGMFTANRYREYKMEVVENGVSRLINKTEMRPESEWIYVPVPPTVSEEMWELANNMLSKNKQMSPRNQKKYIYILSGLIKCATCGYTLVGDVKTVKAGTNRMKETKTYRYYRCTSTTAWRKKNYKMECNQKSISVEKLEETVWSVIRKVIYEPEILLQAMDAEYNSISNQQIIDTIKHLENEINKLEKHLAKDYELYRNDYLTAQEFGEKKRLYELDINNKSREIEQRNNQIITQDKLEQRKEFILGLSERAKQYDYGKNAPTNIKQTLIKSIVETIYVNSNEGWVTITGQIKGTWSLIDNNALHIVKQSLERMLYNRETLRFKIHYWIKDGITSSITLLSSDPNLD